MQYYVSKTLDGSFADVRVKVIEALAQESFGVISEIDVQSTMKRKLGIDFRPYTILGACNPQLAHEALKIEDKVGVMLPCNVIVQQMEDGRVEVAAIDPVASMLAIDNPRLREAAEHVRGKLCAVIERL